MNIGPNHDFVMFNISLDFCAYIDRENRKSRLVLKFDIIKLCPSMRNEFLSRVMEEGKYFGLWNSKLIPSNLHLLRI